MLTATDKIIYFCFSIGVALLLQLISQIKHSRLSFGSGTINKAVVRLVYIIFFATIIIFCAFRTIESGIGGTDAYGYLLQFKNSTGGLFEQLARFRGWEPIHAISLWIVRKFTEDYRIYLCLYYFLLGMCLIKYCTKYELDSKSFITSFALVLYMLNSFNTQRNTFAVYMGFYLLDALDNKKYKKAIIISLIATGIHFSGAIFLISIGGFYFLRYIKGNYYRKLGIYVVFSLVAAALISRLIPTIVGSTRLSIYSSSSNVSVSMLLAFVFITVFQLGYKRQIEEDEELLTLSTLYITFAPMFVFQLYYSILYRLMLYSIPVLYVVIWKYKNMLMSKKNAIAYTFYIVFDVIMLTRVIPFFLAEFSDIGAYSNILF